MESRLKGERWGASLLSRSPSRFGVEHAVDPPGLIAEDPELRVTRPVQGDLLAHTLAGLRVGHESHGLVVRASGPALACQHLVVSRSKLFFECGAARGTPGLSDQVLKDQTLFP